MSPLLLPLPRFRGGPGLPRDDACLREHFRDTPFLCEEPHAFRTDRYRPQGPQDSLPGQSPAQAHQNRHLDLQVSHVCGTREGIIGGED